VSVLIRPNATGSGQATQAERERERLGYVLHRSETERTKHLRLARASVSISPVCRREHSDSASLAVLRIHRGSGARHPAVRTRPFTVPPPRAAAASRSVTESGKPVVTKGESVLNHIRHRIVVFDEYDVHHPSAWAGARSLATSTQFRLTMARCSATSPSRSSEPRVVPSVGDDATLHCRCTGPLGPRWWNALSGKRCQHTHRRPDACLPVARRCDGKSVVGPTPDDILTRNASISRVPRRRRTTSQTRCLRLTDAFDLVDHHEGDGKRRILPGGEPEHSIQGPLG